MEEKEQQMRDKLAAQYANWWRKQFIKEEGRVEQARAFFLEMAEVKFPQTELPLLARECANHTADRQVFHNLAIQIGVAATLESARDALLIWLKDKGIRLQ